MMALPAELLTVNEGAVRVPFWIVLPPAPAAVMVTAARFGDEPPRSTRPPFNVNAPPLPRLPPPLIATKPPLICVGPVYVLLPESVSVPADVL